MKALVVVLSLSALGLGACSASPEDGIEGLDEEDEALGFGDGVADQAPTWAGLRWNLPGGEIPYVIDDWPPLGMAALDALCGTAQPHDGNELQPHVVHQITRVIKDYGEQVKALKFVRYHTATNPGLPTGPFILFVGFPKKASSAWVRGMPDPTTQSRANCIKIGLKVFKSKDDEEQRGAIRHELTHALGADHEQQRSDSDTYIKTQGVGRGSGSKLFGINPNSVLATPYDFGSIMHYASDNGCPKSALNGVCYQPPLLRKKKYRLDPIADGCKDGPYPYLYGLSDASNEASCEWIGHHTPDFSVHDINGLYRLNEVPLGGSFTGDDFGASVVTGDFDGDGYQDLAIGAPHDYNFGAGIGSVYLFKGTAASTSAASRGRLVAWTRLSIDDFTDVPLSNLGTRNNFGAALAAGDFDGDGVTDLAIGATGDEKTGGAVYLYSSRVVDLTVRALYPKVALDEQAFGLDSDPMAGFGSSLAAGDFSRLGYAQLAIGAPGRVINDVRTGAVFVIGEGVPARTLAPVDWKAQERDGARFGESLITGNLDADSDRITDLAMGSPETGTETRRGRVYLALGQAKTGLSPLQVILSPQEDIGFGKSLAVGHFSELMHGSLPALQLAVGAPGWSEGRGKIVVYGPTWGTEIDTPLTFVRTGKLERSGAELGDGFGTTLHVGEPKTTGIATLFVGLPAHNSNNGGIVTFASGLAGANPPQVFTPGAGACGKGGKLGSALGYARLDSPDRRVIAGCSGADGGQIRIGAQDASGISWSTKLRQESANRE